jgi:two-component system, LytTR family, sensor kinase
MWVFIAWWILWMATQTLVVYWAGFAWQPALADSLVYNILLAGVCLLIAHIMQYYLPQKERYWYIAAISTLSSATMVWLSKWIIGWINGGDAIYLSFLKKSLPVRFGIGFLLTACMAMISVIWYTFRDQQENEERRVAGERLAKEAELYRLRQQLQPHFLFNSLNSISALVVSRPEEARHMIHQLSDFLRGTIKKEEHQWVSLAEELQHLQLYLDIEQVRFGHRLKAVIESDETTQAMKLPSLLLQPIVENAIKFGLYDTTDAVTIHIRAIIKEQQLCITVENPFDPETAQPQKGVGFGLGSVQRRLYLLFARNDLVITAAGDHIFTTTLIIPQLK